MKRKKYITGTGKEGITDYMPSPAEVLAEDSINKGKAQADASDNPWAMGIQILGSLAANYAGKLTDPEAQQTSFGKFATKNFANGGIAGASSIEAEGGEVVEAPGGMPFELEGPKHESGGVNMSVPTGTKIYSDRIKIGDKTMAERKQARDSKRKKIEELIEGNKGDIALRNSKNRTVEVLDKEEEQDLMIQQMADMYTGAKQFANGTGPDGVNLNDILSGLFGNQPNFRPVTELNPTTEPSLDAPGFTPIASNSANYEQDQRNLITESFDPPQATLPVSEADPASPVSTGYKPKLGDALGIGGDLISAFGPLINTLHSRATDTPNINAFKGFGEDALEANDQAQSYIQSQKDNADRKIRNNAATSKRAARNSARGVNTQRALDLAIDSGVNDAEINANDVFSRQMMELLSQRAGLENQQDSVVMQGEQARDIADRQDKDNFYTNKGRDISNLGTGVQQIGKDVNNIKEQEMLMTLLNNMSKYFKFDSSGNIIGINQTTKG